MLLHMVADQVAGMVADMGTGMVADKVAGMVVGMAADKKKSCSCLTCCCTWWPRRWPAWSPTWGLACMHVVAHGGRQGCWHDGRHGTCPFYIFCRNQFSTVFDNQRGSMEYIEEVQKQLEVVVVVKEEKIKAGRRCSATLKCSAFNPVCEQDGGINKLLAGDAKVGLQFFNAKDWLQ